ncbi:amidohydrolase family protein [Leptodontidium sp. 2 PMI_412]|nr:amidohydrolase family protein [Leptodontidium sp. 2 PMI_412]
MAEGPPQYPIIDSHIHLYPSTELDTLAWCTPSNPLHSQHSLAEYESATGSPSSLEGFIFLETDRKHDLVSGAEDGTGWEMPLMEVEWLKRIALGTPREGEGHTAEQKKLCLAIIPWAPVPSGSEVLERYVKEVERCAEGSFAKIKGFRYLVQDKPKGTMLTPGFVDGLKWLGREGFVFDLGVDQHGGGKWQLEEAVEMIEKAHEGVPEDEKVTFIINHLCKPDISVYNQTDPSFIAWRTAMFRLSKSSKTFMKLSGCFSEMPSALKNAPVDEIVLALQPYLVVILATFGPFRIMFGSDWPVCTVGVEDDGGAWKKWRGVVQRFCDLASLGTEDQIMIWSGTAIKAYGLKELM